MSKETVTLAFKECPPCLNASTPTAVYELDESRLQGEERLREMRLSFFGLSATEPVVR